MTMRRATVVAGVLVAALIAVLAWKTRDDSHEATTPTPTATSPAAPAAPVAAPAIPAVPRAPVAQATTGSGNDDLERPQPVPLPPSAHPPPLDGKKSEPAPPQKPFTPAETIAKREADLKLLDDTKARLEQELATAKTTHDETASHDLEIRLTRITDLRKKRSSELDQLKGSAQP
jgi:hypothetical protein